MGYQDFRVSDYNLAKGMIVNGKVKQIKTYGAFIEIGNRNMWSFIYRGYINI